MCRPIFGGIVRSLFMSALLPNHDRGKFEIYCYSDTDHVDGVTERLKKARMCGGRQAG